MTPGLPQTSLETIPECAISFLSLSTAKLCAPAHRSEVPENQCSRSGPQLVGDRNWWLNPPGFPFLSGTILRCALQSALGPPRTEPQWPTVVMR